MVLNRHYYGALSLLFLPLKIRYYFTLLFLFSCPEYILIYSYSQIKIKLSSGSAMDNIRLSPEVIEVIQPITVSETNWDVEPETAVQVIEAIATNHPRKIAIKSSCCGYVFEMREAIQESTAFVRIMKHRIEGRGHWESKYSFVLSLLRSANDIPARIRVGVDNRGYFVQLMPSMVQGNALYESSSTLLSQNSIRVYLDKNLEEMVNNREMSE